MSEGSKRKRYALITGATGDIGRALLKAFSNAGYVVIATDIIEKPENLPYEHYLKADLAETVSDTVYANQVFAEIKETVLNDGLSVLINNAATQILGGVDSLSREDWQQTLNVNVLAPFFWIQALLPELEKNQAGSVINISSIHANLSKKDFVAYATSKAALSSLTRTIAVDIGSRVRINAIEPAAIETDMLKAGFAGNKPLYQKLEECHPQQRIGQPEEVAKLALLMADNEIQFLHGAVVALDGGISSRLFDPV